MLLGSEITSFQEPGTRKNVKKIMLSQLTAAFSPVHCFLQSGKSIRNRVCM